MNALSRVVVAWAALCLLSGLARAGTLGPLEYDIDGDTVMITGCDTSVTNVVVPASIEGLPVTAIDRYAFNNCQIMTQITLPTGITAMDDGAFSGCDSLVGFSFPDTVSHVGRSLFYSCDSLARVSLPDDLSGIGDSMFYSCGSLRDINLPAAITNIGENAFMFCGELSTVRFFGEGPVTLGRNAFYATGAEFMIYYPRDSAGFAAQVWDGYPSSPWIFDYEIQNDSITILGCDESAAGRVSIPAVLDGLPVTSIAADAFSGHGSITEIILPATLEEVGARAFAHCELLTGLRMPAGLARVGDYAFQGCGDLVEANFLGPAPVPFGEDVFAGGAAGFTIHYQGMSEGFTTPQWMGYAASPWFLDYEIDGEVIEISECDTNAVGIVSIPATIEGKPVVSVGRHAFSGCRLMDGVEIASSVTNLDVGAFIYCESLTNVVIPAGVVEIGDGAFFDCHSLTTFSVDPANPRYSSADGVLFNIDGSALAFYPNGRTGAYTIPPGVARIEDSAFAGCKGLSDITIAHGVTNIGYAAFAKCDGLTQVDLPPSVVEIGPYAFSDCDALSTVSLPEGLEVVEPYAFWHCPAMTSISLPASVTVFHPTAVSKSPNISSIQVAAGNARYSSLEGVLYNADQTEIIRCPEGKAGAFAMPEGVVRIENYDVFDRCARLTRVVIPSTLADLGSFTFSDCDALTGIDIAAGHAAYLSIDGVVFNAERTKLLKYPRGKRGIYAVPEGVEWIDGFAFRNCEKLKGIVFSASVETIDSLAFAGCPNLRAMTFFCDAPPWFQSSTFSHAAVEVETRYLSGTTGYTSPTWNGVPAAEVGLAEYPFETWRLAHGLDPAADLTVDQNGDGVSPLMAYALDLDPTLDLSASALRAVIEPPSMSVTYYAGKSDVTYTVETSQDLKSWTTTGVTLTDPDALNHVTASVDLSKTNRFLRLRVER